MTSSERIPSPLPRPVAHVVARRLKDAGVLVNLRTNDILELNHTGMRVWELLEEATSVSDVVSHLMHEFDIEHDVAHRDTLDILGRFEAHGVVSP